MRRTVLVVAVLGLLSLTAPPSSGAVAGPDSHTQPLIDGCQRSNTSIALAVPEWVYVNRQQVLAARLGGDQRAGRATVQGVVTDSKPSGDDQFVNHDYVDLSQDVAVDPPYVQLVGTGNRQSPPTIHTEWEDARVPPWAWPQLGDRVRESGNWIWDCGHWGNGPADPTGGVSQLVPYDPAETAQDLAKPGTISGEGTELHPLYEIATFRRDAAGVLGHERLGTVLQHLDVWISGDGTPALREQECALRGIPPAAAPALESTICPRDRDVGGAYSYTIALGPKPDPGSKIEVNPLAVHPETDPDLAKDAAKNVQVTPDPIQGTVAVSFSLPHRASPPVHFGISVEAGWTHAARAVHHVVTIDKIHINASLDGATEPSNNPITGGIPEPARPKEIAPDPGEWVLFVDVSRHWWQVPPDLVSKQGHPFNQVLAGDDFFPGKTYDFWLPDGVSPTLFVSGRECDIPLIDCAKDRYGAPPTDFTHPFLELGFNDDPGRIEDPHSTGDSDIPLGMTPGSVTYAPRVNPSRTSSDERFSDAACGGPCYTMTASAS